MALSLVQHEQLMVAALDLRSIGEGSATAQ
jgi:hypothetical protein